MKKSFKIISVFLITALIAFYACSKDEKKDEEFAIAKSSSTTSGIKVGIDNGNGDYKITADMNELRTAFQSNLTKLEIEGTFTRYEIVQTTIEENREIVYMLMASTDDYGVKTGVMLELKDGFFTNSASRAALILENADTTFASITCTSTQCGRGACVPEVTLHPTTGKKIPNCSTCLKTCTKSATANF